MGKAHTYKKKESIGEGIFLRKKYPLGKTWLLLLALFGAIVFAIPACAQEALPEKTSLTLRFQEQGEIFSGVEFRLYQIATSHAEGTLSPTEDFAKYSLSLTYASASQRRALSQTIEGYVTRDKLTPLQTAASSSVGLVRFSDLPPGLYWIAGDSCSRDGTVYKPSPILITLPKQDPEFQKPVTSVEVSGKVEEEHPGTSTLWKVTKVWKNAEGDEEYPSSVQIQLLKNGAVVDTIALQESNGWSYTWESTEASWQVVEEQVPEGYTVTTEREGTCFTVTNTKVSPDPQEPLSSSTPVSGLPQTGTLWWAVLPLAGAGLLLLFLGCLLTWRQGGPHGG